MLPIALGAGALALIAAAIVAERVEKRERERLELYALAALAARQRAKRMDDSFKTLIEQRRRTC